MWIIDPQFENYKELYYWKNAALGNLQIVGWESRAPSGCHVTYWFNQPKLEARLLSMAVALPFIRIMRGLTAAELEHTPDQITLGLTDTTTKSEGQRICGRFVVGADDANSFVREALALPLIDKGYSFDWLILDMIPEPGFSVSPAQRQLCDPARPTTIVPGGPGLRRWEFMVLPHDDTAKMPPRKARGG